MAFKPEEIDQLEKNGSISPEYAKSLRSMVQSSEPVVSEPAPEPSLIERGVNKVADIVTDPMSYIPPQVKASAELLSRGVEALPSPVSEGPYKTLVESAKNIVPPPGTFLGIPSQVSPAPQIPVEPQVPVREPAAQVEDIKSQFIAPKAQTAPSPVSKAEMELNAIEQRMLKAKDLEKLATQALTDATTKQADAQVEAQLAADKKLSELEKKQQEQVQADLKAQDDAKADYDRAVEEYKNLPEASEATVWAKKSTGDKILAGIAIMLGGLGQGISGKGPNMGLEAVNRSIESELQAQKDAYDRKKEGVQAKQNLYSFMRQRFGDNNLARAAAKGVLLDQTKRQLEITADRYKSPQLKAQAQAAMAKLDAEKAATMLPFVQSRASLKQRTGSLPPGTVLPADTVSQLSNDERNMAVPMPDGSFQIATNKKAAEDFQTYRATVEPAIAGVDRIFSKIQDFNRVTDLTKRAQIQTEIKALAGQLRLPFTGPGALTDKEFDRLMSTLGDPTALLALPSIEKAKLQQVKNKLESDLAVAGKQAGLSVPKVTSFQSNK